MAIDWYSTLTSVHRENASAVFPGHPPLLRSVWTRSLIARSVLAFILRCTLLLAASSAQAGSAVTQGGGEAALVAAFLYNFTIYTEWPTMPTAFEFCVAGEDALGERLDAIAAKQIAGRPIRIHRLGNDDPPGQCNVLFITASANSRVQRLLLQVAERPVLTIADVGISLPAKAMLQLSIEQGQLFFSANQTVARQAGLKFSSKMLRLARRVE